MMNILFTSFGSERIMMDHFNLINYIIIFEIFFSSKTIDWSIFMFYFRDSLCTSILRQMTTFQIVFSPRSTKWNVNPARTIHLVSKVNNILLYTGHLILGIFWKKAVGFCTCVMRKILFLCLKLKLDNKILKK